MKWILGWWIFVAIGHTPTVHYERDFASQEACERYAGTLPVHNGVLRWHCSIQ